MYHKFEVSEPVKQAIKMRSSVLSGIYWALYNNTLLTVTLTAGKETFTNKSCSNMYSHMSCSARKKHTVGLRPPSSALLEARHQREGEWLHCKQPQQQKNQMHTHI